jgi:hypothetical protein
MLLPLLPLMSLLQEDLPLLLLLPPLLLGLDMEPVLVLLPLLLLVLEDIISNFLVLVNKIVITKLDAAETLEEENVVTIFTQTLFAITTTIIFTTDIFTENTTSTADAEDVLHHI